MGDLKVTVTGDVSGLERAFAQAGERIRGSVGSLGEFVNRTLSNFAGNVLARAFTDATSAAEKFFRVAAEGSQDLVRSQRFLASVVGEVGGSFADAQRQATSFARDFAVTTADAQRTLAQAQLTLAQAGNPRDITASQLARAIADLAAARGQTQDRIPEILRTISSGEDEGLNRLGLPNPSVLAAQQAAKDKLSPASLSEQQQRLEILRGVLDAAGKNAGAAAQQLDTFGGKIQAITARAEDFAAKVGEAFGRNKGVQAVAQGVLDFFTKYTTNTKAFEEGLARAGQKFVEFGSGAIETGRTVAKTIVFAYETVKANIALLTGEVESAGAAIVSVISGILKTSDVAISTIQRGFDALAAGAQTLIESLSRAASLLPERFGGKQIADEFGRAAIAISEARTEVDKVLAGGREFAGEAAKRLDATASSLFGEAGGKFKDALAGVKDAFTSDAYGKIDKAADALQKLLPQFGQFDPAAKGIDAVGDAAKRTETAVRSMADALVSAADASRKAFDDRVKTLEQIESIETRLAELAGRGKPIQFDRAGNVIDPNHPGYSNAQFGTPNPVGQPVQYFNNQFGTISASGILPGSEEDRIRRVFDVARRASDPSNPNSALFAAEYITKQLASTDVGAIRRAGFAGEYEKALHVSDTQLAGQDIKDRQLQSENTTLVNKLLNGISEATGGDTSKLKGILDSIPQFVQKVAELPALATVVFKSDGEIEISSAAPVGSGLPYGAVN